MMKTANDQCHASLMSEISSGLHRFAFGQIIFACWLAVLFFGYMHPTLYAVDRADEKDQAQAIEEELPESDQLVFSKNFETAVKEGNQKEINNLIDWSHLVDIATAGESTPAVNRLRKDFKTGFLMTIAKSPKGSFSDVLVENSQQGGSFKFLRLARQNNEPFAQFRLKAINHGVNYQRYFLERSKDGLVRAYDIYVFTSAELLSETIHRIWLPTIEDSSKTLFEKLVKPMDPAIFSLKPLGEMRQLIRDGQPERALETYRKLPVNVQKQKLLLLTRFHAAQLISLEEYETAIEDFRKFYPNDVALDFLLIDGYSLKKEFEKALKCIDRTNENIGGDAWMISLRGGILAQLGRFEEARDAANEAIKMEPDFQDVYLVALSVSVQAKNNADIVTHLTSVESLFGITIADLTQIPDYADFVKSPEYEKWMESRE